MRYGIFAAALLIVGCASATPASAPPATEVGPAVPYDPAISRNPGDAASGAYTLDPRHVSVVFRVRHNGISLNTYRFDTIAGTLNFNPQAPATSSVNITIAANSVSTGILNPAGERAFDHEVAVVLGAETTPNITFVSTATRMTGPTTGVVTGDLTMNGQTHPVDIAVNYIGWRYNELRHRDTIGFEGHTVIDRTLWGVGGAMDRIAGHQVELLIEAEFNKQGPIPPAAN